MKLMLNIRLLFYKMKSKKIRTRRRIQYNFMQLQCQMEGYNTKEKLQEKKYLNIFV